jgi:hypothetical protein
MAHKLIYRPSQRFPITECGPARYKKIFLFQMFFVTGLKAHKGWLSLDGNLQHPSAEITMQLSFQFNRYNIFWFSY